MQIEVLDCGSLVGVLRGTPSTQSLRGAPSTSRSRCCYRPAALTKVQATPESVQLVPSRALIRPRKAGLTEHDENYGIKSSNPFPLTGESASRRPSVPQRFVSEFVWRGLRFDEDIGSGSEVNRLVSELVHQGLHPSTLRIVI